MRQRSWFALGAPPGPLRRAALGLDERPSSSRVLGTLRRPSARRRRGFALADFIGGTLLFTGSLVGFSVMTRSKMDALALAEQHASALAQAETAADQVRLSGLPAAPSGEADLEGFRLCSAFDVVGGLPGAVGRVEARRLRVLEGEAHGLWEARVVVRWRERADSPRTTQVVIPVVAREAKK